MEHKRKKRWLGISFLFIFTAASVVLAFWTYFSATPPKITLNGEATERVALGSVYIDKGAVASAGSHNLDERIQTVGTVDTTNRGTYTIEYRLQYRGSILTAERQVTVVDNVPPVMQLNGAESITVSHKSFFKDPGVTAVDNLEGDVTAKVTVTEQQNTDNNYTVFYSVKDADGNTAQLARELIVKDVIKPVIKLNGGSKIMIVEQDKYNDSGATAKDDLDGNISSKITVSGGVDTSRIGTQTIVYTVQDSSGNTASVERVVTVVSKAVAAMNKIFLTFDDGPSSTVTVRILDTLKQNNVKATFFILDYGADKKPIIQRMINEGHTIGIHGYSHDFSKIYASDAAFMENISKLRDKLIADFGYHTNLIRFPGGSSNTVSRKYSKGIMSRLVKLLPESGYIYYDWNISSNDAVSGTSSKDYIVSSVINALQYGRNNIVLLHDTAAKTTTADSLQEIINYGKTNAYVFEPLTGAIPPAQHGVQN